MAVELHLIPLDAGGLWRELWPATLLRLRAERARRERGWSGDVTRLTAAQEEAARRGYGAVHAHQRWQDGSERARRFRGELPERPEWIDGRLRESLVEWNRCFAPDDLFEAVDERRMR